MSDAPISQAFILAAGLGTRMKPITDTRPKPLVEVAGRTLLDHALDGLRKAGVTRVALNVHYLADQIDAHVAQCEDLDIAVSNERGELLDSGGGVKNGLHLLGDDTIFVLNADSFWVDNNRSNLAIMQDFWNNQTMDILLLLAKREHAVGFDGPGDFFCDDSGHLKPRGKADSAPFVYAGAFIIKSALFDNVDEKAFSLIKLFNEARERGRLFGHVLDGLWLHVGTPAAIGEAEEAIAQRAIKAGAA